MESVRDPAMGPPDRRQVWEAPSQYYYLDAVVLLTVYFSRLPRYISSVGPVFSLPRYFTSVDCIIYYLVTLVLLTVFSFTLIHLMLTYYLLHR